MAAEIVGVAEPSNPVNDIENFSNPVKEYDPDSVIRLTNRRNMGLVMHNFTVGLVWGTVWATRRGLFLGYLNMDTYLYTISINICEVPNAFTFFFGMVSDTHPLFGRRRRPYMVLGWALIATALCVMSLKPLPAPYYCIDAATGDYLFKDKPCNPEAKHEFVLVTMMFFLVALGTVISSSACDALLVEYARKEDEKERGSLQTSLMMVRKTGEVLAVLLTAFAFNGKLYTGSFDQRDQLDFNQISMILAAFAVFTLCTCFFVPDAIVKPSDNPNVSMQARGAWALLSGKGFFCVVAFLFVKSGLSRIMSPAGPKVGLQWAGVKLIQQQLAGLLGVFFAALGIWLAKNYLLNVSWRKTFAVAQVTTAFIDAIPQFLTIWDVVRNPYFYLGEPLLDNVLLSVIQLMNTLLSNELADDDNAGLVAGTLATISFLAELLSRVLSNQIFGLFHPSLSDTANFVADTAEFRATVSWSFVLSYVLFFTPLVFLPLLPRQKQEARQRKEKWGSKPCFAYLAVVTVSCAFAYTVLVDVLSLLPGLSCLHFVGGEGC